MPAKAHGLYLVPRLWFGARYFLYISWQFKAIISRALAGHTGFANYFAQDLYFV